MASNVDMVIEAIYENLEAKQSIFQQLDKICDSRTIFASNTSSISMTSLAAATSRPEKVVGMHFFSPVPVMSLVEIVYGLRTSKETIDIVDESWARAWVSAPFWPRISPASLSTVCCYPC